MRQLANRLLECCWMTAVVWLGAVLTLMLGW
jgi:hypothetical protein